MIYQWRSGPLDASLWSQTAEHHAVLRSTDTVLGGCSAISPGFSGEFRVRQTPFLLWSSDDSSPHRGGRDVSAADMLQHAYGVKSLSSSDDPYGLIQLGLTVHVSLTSFICPTKQAQDRCLVLHQRVAVGASMISTCYITAHTSPSYSPAILGFEPSQGWWLSSRIARRAARTEQFGTASRTVTRLRMSKEKKITCWDCFCLSSFKID